ncbi:MAG: UDP-N-acetylmuramoyl-L-alanyl-D-glutamate--2,6-diaminopimelate ligase [Planctomycetota bacterium]
MTRLCDLSPLVGLPIYEEVEITGVQLDSREIRPGDLFVAISGHHIDAIHYLSQALQRGARAVLSAQRVSENIPQIVLSSSDEVRRIAGQLVHYFAGNPSSKLKNYGVTGTNGKTTMTYLLAEVFGIERCGIVGTIDCRYQEVVLPSKNTTPSPVEMIRFLKKAMSQGMTHLAFEASSHALDQHRLSGLKIHGALFTNLSPEHQDYHSDMAHYARSKKRLLEMVPENAPVVICLENKYSEAMKTNLNGRVWTYGFSPSADIWGEVSKSSLYSGVSGKIHFPEGSYSVALNLVGAHNFLNAIGAATLAYAEGLSPAIICARLSKLKRVPGRLERLLTSDGKLVFIDYAHTPDALEKVLLELRRKTQSRLICVFGCGGERDQKKRPMMGKIVEQLADEIFLTSDNPRREDPKQIIQDILNGMDSPAKVSVELDRTISIHRALDLAQPGDIVLIAGKGHEEYQQIGEQKFPFSDRSVVEKK